VTALAKTLNFRLSGPVKVAVSAVKPGAQVSDELVLPAQDDSAYNKPAAQRLRSDLDARISNVREEHAAYEQRRDQGTSTQERLLRYLNDYGATRLNQARASIDQLGAEQDAAIERHQHHLENAKRWAEQSSDIAARKAPLPTQIAGYDGDIRRLQEFHREFEADIDKKRARLLRLT
jgi:chromosome segregation ATPase